MRFDIEDARMHFPRLPYAQDRKDFEQLPETLFMLPNQDPELYLRRHQVRHRYQFIQQTLYYRS